MTENNDIHKTQDALLEAIKRGASMEDIAKLKHSAVEDPAHGLERLKAGNARFFGGTTIRPESGANERRAQIIGQTPYAAILACSDSRVPVEMVFDEGFGQLFVIRVAGNVVNDAGLGTLEYAIKHLHVHVIMVLGHEGCGAVAAAMLPDEALNAEPDALRELIRVIQPSVQDMPRIRDKKARMREAVMNNIRLQVHNLRQKKVIQEAEAAGQIKVVGGFYEIGSGAVDFLLEADELALEDHGND